MAWMRALMWMKALGSQWACVLGAALMVTVTEVLATTVKLPSGPDPESCRINSPMIVSDPAEHARNVIVLLSMKYPLR